MSSTNRCPLTLEPELLPDRNTPRLADFLRAVLPESESPQSHWQGGSTTDWSDQGPVNEGDWLSS